MPLVVRLVALLIPASALAAPAELPHSGFLIDQADQPVNGAALAFTFAIFDDPTLGARVWPIAAAASCSVAVSNGYFAVRLGVDCGVGLDTSHLPATAPRWLEVSVAGVTLSPRVRLAALPAAAVAGLALDADRLGGELPSTYRDASRLTGALPAGVLSASASSITAVGTVTSGAIADAAITSAFTWNAKLGVVAVSAPLTGNGTAGNPLGVPLASSGGAGLLSAADKAKLDALSGTYLQAVATSTPLSGDGTVGSPLVVSPATTGAPGLMSATDKTKLDGLNGALYLQSVSAAAPLTGNGTAGNPITAPVATTSVAGLMSASDKTKLDGLGAGAGGGLTIVSSRPGSPTTGALYFNTTAAAIEFWDGARWRTFVQTAASTGAGFYLRAENNLVDQNGNYPFTSTAATQYDLANYHSGSAGLTSNTYYNSPSSWAAETTSPSTLWSLHPSFGDFEFDWWYRHTSDSGYGTIPFAATNAFAGSLATYTNTSGSVSLPTVGWMITISWTANLVYFLTPNGFVSWPYVGYHTAWKRLQLRRIGATLELFIDGVTQGTRTAPTISDATARTLYVMGSPNSANSGYPAGTNISQRAQVDDLRFHAPFPGTTAGTALASCKALQQAGATATGRYYINPGGSSAFPVWCDMDTDGGGWTLAYSYQFANYASFSAGTNATTPRPNWSVSGANVPVSTTAPGSETTTGAIDYALWPSIGTEFLAKSNIDHWYACLPGTGSIVNNTNGTITCRVVQLLATPACATNNVAPTGITGFGVNFGPYLTPGTFYYWDGSTTSNWPTHDPCGNNGTNQITGASDPRGWIYLR